MITTTILSMILSLGACDTECHDLPNGIECDDGGRCWALHPSWDMSAQSFDEDGLAEGLEGSTLEPTMPAAASAQCWRYGEPGDYGMVCRLRTLCYDLVAIPVSQLVDPVGECPGEPVGAWDYTIDTAFGCYGAFHEGDLAVKLL